LSGLLLIGLPRGLSHAGPAPRVWTLLAESPAVLGRLWRHPALRTNMLLAVFASAAAMMNVPNSYGLALEVFDRGAAGLAALEVFVAVGLIVGGLLFSRMRLEGDKNAYVLSSLVMMAICLIAVSFSAQFWVAILLMGLGGVASVGMFVPSITMYQEIPAAPDRGRLIAVRSGFGQLGVMVGYLLGGLLGAELGIRQLLFVAGVATILISVVIYVPYRMRASRRAKTAWTTAMEAGARRSTARQIAEQAAFTGIVTIPGETSAAAWAMAAEAVTTEEK
jgi:predicted MFS family arabinose efflux permease